MGRIYKPVTLTGTIGCKTLNALVDSNASWSYIRKKDALSIAPFSRIAKPVAGKIGSNKFQAEEIMICNIELNGYGMFGSFIVVPELADEVVIGRDFLQSWKIEVDRSTEEVIIDPSAMKIQLI